MQNLKEVFLEEISKEKKQEEDLNAARNVKFAKKGKILEFIKFYFKGLTGLDNDFSGLQLFLLFISIFVISVTLGDEMTLKLLFMYFMLISMQVLIILIANINFKERNTNDIKVMPVNIMNKTISKKMFQAMVSYLKNKETLSLLFSENGDCEELNLTYAQVKKFINIEDEEISEKIMKAFK